MNRIDDGHQESRAAVTSSALVTCFWWSSVTEPGQHWPKYGQSSHWSFCINTDISVFSTHQGKDLVLAERGKIKERISHIKEVRHSLQNTKSLPVCLAFSSVKLLHRLCSRTPHITFWNLKALNQSHTLAHLASNPSSVAFRISPATRLNSAAKGHGGPALPLPSPNAPTEEARGGCLSSRPTAQFHSEWHAASRLYEMEPHNQIEKPQCRTV